MPKITKDTVLDELLDDPKAQKIMAKHNLPCLSCPFAQLEAKSLKLGEVCKMYKIDLKKLFKELNEVCGK